jgi:hexosaminidase
MQTGTTPLILSQNFRVSVNNSVFPEDLLDAIAQMEHYLWNDRLERLVVGRGAADAQAIAGAKLLTCLTVTLAHNGPALSVAQEALDYPENRDEEYSLIVPTDGSPAVLTANSTLGLYRGLTTFSQLWYFYAGTVYTLDAPIQILDSPAYVCNLMFLQVLYRLDLSVSLIVG